MLLAGKQGEAMTEATPAVAPAPMEGEGAYNRNSHVQEDGSSPAIPLFEEAARLVALPPPSEVIGIADYGSSQGHNSFRPMRVAIRALAALGVDGVQTLVSLSENPQLTFNGWTFDRRMMCAEDRAKLRDALRPLAS